jgi:methylated-DNA-[protein]-cysteine S-methyltransferase
LIRVVAHVSQTNQLRYVEDSPRKMHSAAEALRLKGRDIYYWEFQCDGLTVQVASSGIGAVRVSVGFTRREDFVSQLRNLAPAAKFFEDFKRNETLIRTLKAYFKGDKPLMNLPWDIDATAFRHKVWKSVCTIPYGETRTYKDIAAMVGTPKGARAVGQALNRNRLLILIPCHRVVAANGLGGFGSGIEMKRYLLKLEQG